MIERAHELSDLFRFEDVRAHSGATATAAETLSVVTPSGQWTYAASLPLRRERLNDTEAASAAAVIRVEAVVERGSIGIGCLREDCQTFIDETIHHGPGGPKTFVLTLDSLGDCRWLMVRNCSDADEPSEVTIRSIQVFRLTPSELYDTDTTLFVFYDLHSNAISFDIAWFLMAAEITRRDRNLAGMYVIFVPGKKGGLRDLPTDYASIVDQHAQRWRLRNVVIPMLDLFPSITGHTLAATRREAVAWKRLATHSYPDKAQISSLSLAEIHRFVTRRFSDHRSDGGLRAGEQGLLYVRQWLETHAKDRKLVAITLRQYPFLPERNSNIESWSAFARGLDRNEFMPVFVPDTDTAMMALPPELDGLALFPEASWNLGLRMALYESAYINLFTNTGPAALCLLSDRCRYLYFKILIPSIAEANETFMRNMGFKPGKTPPFATGFQKWVWEDDSIDVIEREFRAMCAAIESS